MKEYEAYVVIDSISASGLVEGVIEAMRQGLVPIGGVSVSHGNFVDPIWAQAMVRPTVPATETCNWKQTLPSLYKTGCGNDFNTGSTRVTAKQMIGNGFCPFCGRRFHEQE